MTYSNSNLDPGSYLPTLTKLGEPHVPQGLDSFKVASAWLQEFGKHCEQGNVEGALSTLIESSFASNLFKGDTLLEPTAPNDIPVYWRDALALTWDLRTFEGTQKVKDLLASQLSKVKISNVRLHQDHGMPELQRVFPDLVWIQLVFKFETEVGLCSGVARLVPVATSKDQNVEWKAFTIFTNLDDLKGFPENIGSLRAQHPNHGKWERARQEEVKFADNDPTVLIMGGGHMGLQVAARLKTLGVQHLIIEKNERVGDNWRDRYDALCLHDPVYSNHMPYLPFPPSWPVYTPAKKLANWLEHYAEAMELNVWVSSTVLNAKQDPKTELWSVTVRKYDGTERVFRVRHVVFAVGFMGGEGYIPSIPGANTFNGEIIHSSQHRNAAAHVGKKVVVVGAGSSGHDICMEYADHGIDVTMFQRSSTYVISSQKSLAGILLPMYSESGPPTGTADLLGASIPMLVASSMGSRLTKIVAEADKDILDGLHKRGFRTNDGYKGCGLFPLLFTKGGGCYMDVGGSQAIIDGKIKLKNGSEINEFFERGLRFEDGSELSADIVIFCTGFTNASKPLRRIFGDQVADNSIPIWGLTEEGELSGCYREIGFSGLYGVMGNISKGRFYSKHVALQIKAVEESVVGDTRYKKA